MTISQEPTARCLVCEKDSQLVPLVAVQYQDSTFWICPQHLPILIHKPQELAGRLPGAEHLDEANHEH